MSLTKLHVFAVNTKRSLVRNNVNGPRYFRQKRNGLRLGSGWYIGHHRRIRSALLSKTKDTKPSIQIACAMPNSYSEMDNSSLAVLGSVGIHGARHEILLRHIMATDHCDYDEAQLVFKEIDKKNAEYAFMLSLPHQLGILSALTIGFVSFPMVFHFETAALFNEYFVTTDIPDPRDLETVMEIGSWSWNWMEPPLGTLSFMLLCMQYARSQIQNLGVKPYTESIKQWRGERLVETFPRYNARLLQAFSESATLYRGKETA